MMKHKIELRNMVPFISFALIFIILTIMTQGKMISAFNLLAILDQTIIIIIAGCGTIFVMAQGSVDLSIGVTLALAGIVSSIVVTATGMAVLLIPVALLVGLGMGLLNGVIVSKFKVPSFMSTLAMLIGMRGIINYIQTVVGLHTVPSGLLVLNRYAVKIPILIVLVAIMLYLFEYTKLGRLSKAIGENETATRFTGISIRKMKIIAYILSGLLAGLASIFTMAKLGGTSTTMGTFFEIQVVMAIYLGGVLVTGGTSAKMYKLLVGAFTIVIIENGLVLCGLSSSEVSEAVKGMLLMLILFFTIYFDNYQKKAKKRKTGAKVTMQRISG